MAREAIAVNGVVSGCVAKTSDVEQRIWAKRGEDTSVLTYARIYLSDPKGSKAKVAVKNAVNDALAPFVAAFAGMNPGNPRISGEDFVSELFAKVADAAGELLDSTTLQNEIVREASGLSDISEGEFEAEKAKAPAAVSGGRKATTSDDI